MRAPFVVVAAAKVVDVVFRRLHGFVDTFRFRFALYRNGIRYGSGCRAIGMPSVRVSLGGKAVVGDFLYWRTGTSETDVGGLGSRLIVGHKGQLVLGNYVGISNATIVCYNSVTIGDHVHIGGGVQIFDTDFHSLDARVRNAVPEDYSEAKTSPIIIGNGCFLGANAIVCKGVTIGENAVVGAGSVVTHNIGRGEVWAGNPARLLREGVVS